MFVYYCVVTYRYTAGPCSSDNVPSGQFLLKPHIAQAPNLNTQSPAQEASKSLCFSDRFQCSGAFGHHQQPQHQIETVY